MNIQAANNYQRIESYNLNNQVKLDSEKVKHKVTKLERTNRINKINEQKHEDRKHKENKTNKISQDIREQVLMLGKNNRSANVIAKELNLKETTVKSILRANGLDSNQKDKKPTVDLDIIRKLYDRGMTVEEMAKALNKQGISVTQSEVKQTCYMLGLRNISDEV